MSQETLASFYFLKTRKQHGDATRMGHTRSEVLAAAIIERYGDKVVWFMASMEEGKASGSATVLVKSAMMEEGCRLVIDVGVVIVRIEDNISLCSHGDHDIRFTGLGQSLGMMAWVLMNHEVAYTVIANVLAKQVEALLWSSHPWCLIDCCQ
ncbi:hypothetical protein RIF29_29058 [Crotalaria pallida]|uniref:Uncharacterized protein n=1 Tax=Crotalaria pallida TaxID=3830 RepID=A0AAN9EEA6_CROPI